MLTIARKPADTGPDALMQRHTTRCTCAASRGGSMRAADRGGVASAARDTQAWTFKSWVVSTRNKPSLSSASPAVVPFDKLRAATVVKGEGSDMENRHARRIQPADQSDRLWDSLMEMAKIGPGDCRRQQPPDADRRRRRGPALFKRWCEAAGLTMGVDQMGTMFATPRGRRPGRAAGLCRQPSRHPADRRQVRRRARRARRAGGGALDERSRHPDQAPDRRDQLDQRGGRALRAGDAGLRRVRRRSHSRTTPMAARTCDGKVFGDELERIGWKGDEQVGARKMHAIFELHIEQGPILEAEGKEIGVVTHGQGLWWLEFTLTGKEAHTGSTPMAHARQCRARHGAHHRDGARGRDGLPAGRGRRGRPGGVLSRTRATSFAGTVVFTVDIRSPDQARARPDATRAVRDGSAHDLRGARRRLRDRAGRPFRSGHLRPGLVKAVRDAAERLGYSHRNIVSGAGHDACWINRVAPTAMVMCPCVDGLSHNEAEEISQGMGGGGRGRAVPRGGGDGGDRGVRVR